MIINKYMHIGTNEQTIDIRTCIMYNPLFYF